MRLLSSAPKFKKPLKIITCSEANVINILSENTLFLSDMIEMKFDLFREYHCLAPDQIYPGGRTRAVRKFSIHFNKRRQQKSNCFFLT